MSSSGFNQVKSFSWRQPTQWQRPPPGWGWSGDRTSADRCQTRSNLRGLVTSPDHQWLFWKVKSFHWVTPSPLVCCCDSDTSSISLLDTRPDCVQKSNWGDLLKLEYERRHKGVKLKMSRHFRTDPVSTRLTPSIFLPLLLPSPLLCLDLSCCNLELLCLQLPFVVFYQFPLFHLFICFSAVAATYS